MPRDERGKEKIGGEKKLFSFPELSVTGTRLVNHSAFGYNTLLSYAPLSLPPLSFIFSCILTPTRSLLLVFLS